MVKNNNTAAIAVVAAVVALGASFLLDKPAAILIQAIKTPLLNSVVSAFDKLYWWVYFAFLALTIAAAVAKGSKEKKTRNVLLLLSTVLTAVTITRLLKFIIQRQRPDGTAFTLPFFGVQDYSFPSGHATATAAAAFASPAFLKVPWLIFTAATMFDRVYLNVHFLSDTVAGILVAMLVTSLLRRLKAKIVSEDWMEARRQALHAIIGLAIAAFIWKYPQLWYVILVIAAAGMALSYAIKSAAAKPFSEKGLSKNAVVKKFGKLAVAALKLVERKEELQSFPGKGAIMLFLGAGITVAIFREQAVAAIAILAVGDSISPLAGKFLGKTGHKGIFASNKTVEGTVAGFIFAAAAAAFLVPVWTAIIAAAAGMAVEAVNVRILKRKIDDNLTVPVVAAAVMWGLKVVLRS
ncbi:phosphatase PAP2 family protein [Candidatus Woesearchaeota archaeon]|nr:phosphatase PAP2 family protein [Candidatus Woesearchaeota archaeon]